jgi:16S rRNA (uracil1498-N3)-methyltransferase
VETWSAVGVARFVPLMTERSVVHPEGRNKIERWERLAGEAARQSRRVGVMGISELRKLEEVIEGVEGRGGFLSTAPGGGSLVAFVGGKIPSAEADPTGASADREERWAEPTPRKMLLLVGPEGGWTEGEEGRMAGRGLTAVTLGATILRVETAAIAAAAVVAAVGA